MATDDRIDAYSDALFRVAVAEGRLDEVEDELFRFARVLEGSDELRAALTDPATPPSRRQQIAEDLLANKATTTTVALISMVVGAGRAADLPLIINSLVDKIARASNKVVAEARSAISLTEDQRQRLAKALSAATGKDVEVKVIVDPRIMGGIVAQIGDTVIDGSVRHRLEQLRKVF
jgi:F-type H+-transporting ATPase subunit delta